MNEEVLHQLIENEIESDYLDFKATSYHKENHEALVKDIMAMANSLHDGDKYIITGVNDDINDGREILGIDEKDVIDDANYQQLISERIEPDIKFRYFTIKYGDKKLGIFHLFNNTDRPFISKKSTRGIRKGLCLIRKGSHQTEASRGDFDKFYQRQNNFEVQILEPLLSAVCAEEACAHLRVSLRNLTHFPVTIMYGGLIVKNRNGDEVSRHRMYGLDKFVGAEFIIYLPANSEQTGYLYLGFESSDCLRLDLDEYGHTDEKFIFELQFIDSKDNKYQTSINDGLVFARGKFLWKVQMKASKERENEGKNTGMFSWLNKK